MRRARPWWPLLLVMLVLVLLEGWSGFWVAKKVERWGAGVAEPEVEGRLDGAVLKEGEPASLASSSSSSSSERDCLAW